MELAQLTTLKLGGPASSFVEVYEEAELVEQAADAALVMAGGSNVVIADEGVEGNVVRIATHGVERDGNRLRVAAGEDWDALVERCVEEGLQGFECLSGIPGSVGATPIQNVGAYGQEVAETVESVKVFDRQTGEIAEMSAGECGFVYRGSIFKYHDRRVILSVTFRLAESAQSGPLRYAELARALDREIGDTAPLEDVREAVLGLRRRKGMVIDPHDPDSVSAGSFFTNPILDRGAAGRARVARARRPGQDLGRLADRAGRLPQGLRQRSRRDLHQAHARARQPRRRDHAGADGARPRDRRRACRPASASRCTPSRCSSATAGSRGATAAKPPARIVGACTDASHTPRSPPWRPPSSPPRRRRPSR